MGKNGAAMREAKRNETKFVVSRAWLEDHDKEVRKNYREIVYSEAQKWLDAEMERVNKEIEAEWKQREKDFGEPDSHDRFLFTLGYMLSVACKVLIRDFKWTPLPKDRYITSRYRIYRFCKLVADEIADICEGEDNDIRDYCEKVYEDYGVKFNWGEENENGESSEHDNN